VSLAAGLAIATEDADCRSAGHGERLFECEVEELGWCRAEVWSTSISKLVCGRSKLCTKPKRDRNLGNEFVLAFNRHLLDLQHSTNALYGIFIEGTDCNDILYATCGRLPLCLLRFDNPEFTHLSHDPPVLDRIHIPYVEQGGAMSMSGEPLNRMLL
jgi:hypothetical protein